MTACTTAQRAPSGARVVLVSPYELGRQPFNLAEPAAWRSKIEFLLPDRSVLPPLARYARLNLPDGAQKTVGFAEASRGCKHLCRRCSWRSASWCRRAPT